MGQKWGKAKKKNLMSHFPDRIIYTLFSQKFTNIKFRIFSKFSPTFEVINAN